MNPFFWQDWVMGIGDADNDDEISAVGAIGTMVFGTVRNGIHLSSVHRRDLNSTDLQTIVPATFKSPRYISDGFPRFPFADRTYQLNCLAPYGNKLLVGGSFSFVNGNPALCLVELDPLTGEAVPSFSVHFQRPGAVLAMGRQPDGKLVIGGEFSFVGDLPRGNLARFNQDGSLDTTWFPEADGAVTAVDGNENGLFIGGLFTRVTGVPRQFIAKLNLTANSGPDLSWDVGDLIPYPFDGRPSTPFRDLAVIGDKVFAAAFMTNGNFAVLDASTAQVEWTSSSPVTRLLAGPPGKVTVAGDFDQWDGVPRSGLARINASFPHALDLQWAPPFDHPGGSIVGMALDTNSVFVATAESVEKFQVNGNGAVVPGWVSPDAFALKDGRDFGVRSLSLVGSNLYVGGLFPPIGSPAPPVGVGGKTILVRLNAGTGAIDAEWNGAPSTNSDPVATLLAVNDRLYVGGEFARFGTESRFGLALLAITSGPILTRDAAGRLLILRHPLNGADVTHFRITAISGGSLYHCDNLAPIQPGDFITVAEGESGLCFVPSGGAANVTAVAAVNERADGAGTAAGSIDPTAPSSPVLSFSQAEYVVSESQAAVDLFIVKRGGGSGIVAVTAATSDGTATASQGFTLKDYRPASGRINVGATNALVRVLLDGDTEYEGDEVFYVTLSDPSAGGRLAYPAQARVFIVDDDRFGPDGSFLTNAPPSPAPAATGSLTVYLTPDSVGQWRLVGGWDWYSSGQTVSGLVTTNYQVEFRRVLDFQEPDTLTLSILGSQSTFHTNAYQAIAPSGQTASLAVVLDPAEVLPNAQWQVAGETNWHRSGEVASGLRAGWQEIVIKPLSGYLVDVPDPVVWVSADRIRTNFARYVRAPGGGTVLPQPLSLGDVTNTPPYLYNGQLKTSLGVGSGVVVKEGVVLTAAHLLFNDHNLEIVPAGEVHWLFQHHRGQYEPVPQTPYGTVLLRGYAAQRTNDLQQLGITPNVSTPQSQNLDVGFLFFLEPAGRGGFGGFLAADDPNEHLLSNRLKMLAGYPKDGIPEANQGKLHATVPTNITFQLLYPGKSVYVTTALKSFPGNSGGPLYVQSPTDTRYFPAAVYVGQTSAGETLVRGIDSLVVDWINRVEELSTSGPNHPGGGFSPFIPGVTGQPIGTGLLTFELAPVAARAAGAGWRIAQNRDTSWVTNATLTYALTGGVDYDLEFRTAPGFIAPEKRLIRVDVGEVSALPLRYTAWPGELALPRLGELSLLGSNHARYTIEYTDAFSPTNTWRSWTNFTASNNTTRIQLPAGTNAAQRFFRARLTP
jgi:hypothetical protein